MIHFVYNFTTTRFRFLRDIEDMIGRMNIVARVYFMSMWYVGTPAMILFIIILSVFLLHDMSHSALRHSEGFYSLQFSHFILLHFLNRQQRMPCFTQFNRGAPNGCYRSPCLRYCPIHLSVLFRLPIAFPKWPFRNRVTVQWRPRNGIKSGHLSPNDLWRKTLLAQVSPTICFTQSRPAGK